MAATDTLSAADAAFAPPGKLLKLAIGIATSGRPAILAETLRDLAYQTRPADQVFITYGKAEDVADLPARFPSYVFSLNQGGLCEKRNLIMDAAADFDLLFFMDDDFYLDPGYLRVTEEAFLRDEQIVATTGVVLADGDKGQGLTDEEARQALRQATSAQLSERTPSPSFNTYGCNMAFRLATVREYRLRFDERMPGYGWYEDIDFSRRLAGHGSLVRVHHALGVHLGAKVGRPSGIKLGYSQVANPIYLARKGSFPWGNTVRSAGRHLLINLMRSIAPESYIDRRGRLQGNLLAVLDLLRGRLDPERILLFH